MVFNFNQFLLLEKKNRIDFLRNQFKSIDNDTFNDLISLDVSSNNKYSQWILNLYKNNKLKKEDFYKVSEYLNKFEQVKGKLNNKDINSYKSLPELINTIKNIGGAGKPTDNEDYLLNDRYYINNGEAEIFTEDDNYLIVIPNTYNASKFYANKTEWCTKYPEMYEEYTIRGNLYIIINKNLLNTNNNLRMLQFSFSGTDEDGTAQFMDINDKELSTDVKKTFFNFFKDVNYGFMLKYDYVSEFYMDITTVHMNDKVGVINDVGNIILPIEYDGVDINDGDINVLLNGKYGLYDIQGDEILPIKYDEYIISYNDCYKVMVDNMYGLVSANKKEILECKYTEINMIMLRSQNYIYNDIRNVYNKYNHISYFSVLTDENKYGCFDKNGNIIILDEYDMINNYCIVLDDKKYIDYKDIPFLFIVQKNGKCGLCDENGNERLPLIYDKIDVFGDKTKINKGNKKGILNGDMSITWKENN